MSHYQPTDTYLNVDVTPKGEILSLQGDDYSIDVMKRFIGSSQVDWRYMSGVIILTLTTGDHLHIVFDDESGGEECANAFVDIFTWLEATS
jgi:hypothetical protein